MLCYAMELGHMWVVCVIYEWIVWLGGRRCICPSLRPYLARFLLCLAASTSCTSPPLSPSASSPFGRRRAVAAAPHVKNDSPHPQLSLTFGLLKTNLALSVSSCQSISDPMMLKSALLSMSTSTPSCRTRSSNLPAWSGVTYSRW